MMVQSRGKIKEFQWISKAVDGPERKCWKYSVRPHAAAFIISFSSSWQRGSLMTIMDFVDNLERLENRRDGVPEEQRGEINCSMIAMRLL